MSRRKQSAGLATRDREAPPATDEIHELRSAVERLADEVRVLRQVLDDIRDDFAWALNNAEKFRYVPGIHPLTSMPKDPLAPDFGERINRFAAKDLPPDQGASGTEPVAADAPRQDNLF